MLSLIVFLPFAMAALNGNVKEYVEMPKLASAPYNNSEKPLEIPCTTPEMLSNASFPKWVKVWRVNNSEAFDPTRITFINNYASAQLVSVMPKDNGRYECCIHGYAYEDFICYVTELTVIESNEEGVIDQLMGNDTVTPSEATGNASAATTPTPSPPAWFLLLVDGKSINAENASMYFIRLFDENTTAVTCLHENAPVNFKTSQKVTDMIFADVIIPDFNATAHEGEYFCNGTMGTGNDTIIETASFTIVASSEENVGAVLVPEKEAALFRKDASGWGTLWLLPVVFLIVFS